MDCKSALKDDWENLRGKQWAEQISGLESMLSPIDEPLINALNLESPLSIADIGCGGGRSSIEILRRAPRGSSVCGYDISETLLEIARSRISDQKQSLVFKKADLETEPAPQQPFDRLVSRFGVMFFTNPERAFKNLANFLAPGGSFVFAVWGKPQENRWSSTAREILSALLELPALDPEAPGPFRYADPQKFIDLLEEAGFCRLQSRQWRGKLSLGGKLNVPEAVDFALAAFSSFGELLQHADDKTLEKARKELLACYSEHYSDGSVRMEAVVNLVSGSKAG